MEAVEDTGSVLVGLQGKGELPGESFNISRNRLSLGGAASPGVSDVRTSETHGNTQGHKASNRSRI